MNKFIPDITAGLLNASLSIQKSSIENTKLYTGTKQLLADATTYLMIISAALAVVLFIVFSIAKMWADEQEMVKWKKRLINVVICLALIFAASGILAVIANYYQ